MKIILHLGAHKTASTHLQYNISLNQDLLEKNKIKYFRFHETGSLRGETIELRRNLQDPTLVKELTASIQDRIQKEIKNYETAIISYEGILGELNQYGEEKIYPDAEELAGLYREILAGHEVIPVFAIRNYHDFMISSYKFCLKYDGINHTLNDYLKDKKNIHNRWSSIIDVLDKTFDHSPKIFTQEDYRKNWQEIIFEIIRLTGKEIKFEELTFDSTSQNVSGSAESLDFYYTINRFKHSSPQFKGKARIHKFLRKESSRLSSTPISSFLKKHKEEEITPLNKFEDYKEEVSRLSEKFGLL